jgi:hypothetical protein
MKGKWKIVYAQETTNNITTAIINFLLSKGHSASRINVQGQYDESILAWRKSGSRKGFYDIVCSIKGKFVAIDIKKGKDFLSDDQLKFKGEVIKDGGYAVEFRDYQEFIDWYNLNVLNEIPF